MLRVGILISGRGSNMEALIKASYDDCYPVSFEIVLSNRPDAKGIKIAQGLGVRTAIVDHKRYKSRAGFEADLNVELKKYNLDLICNAGFMRVLTGEFVQDWYNKLINIHPSLLPLYKGLNSYNRAIGDGVRISGCSVHYVRDSVDSGPIIAQASVPVYSDDDENSLSARILRQEHKIYPRVVQALAKGEVSIDGDNISIRSNKNETLGMIVC